MKKNKLIFTAALVIACASLTGCDKHPDVMGAWTGMPDRSLIVAGAIDATSTVTLDFAAQKSTGATDNLVTITTAIDASQPVVGNDGVISSYEASIAASASMSGTWSFIDDDDIIIHFDMSTFNVNIDPAGVTYNENMLTGQQQPETDSLTAMTAERWKQALTPAIKTELLKYVTIDDIKIKNGIMTFEINDRDYTFRRNSI